MEYYEEILTLVNCKKTLEQMERRSYDNLMRRIRTFKSDIEERKLTKRDARGIFSMYRAAVKAVTLSDLCKRIDEESVGANRKELVEDLRRLIEDQSVAIFYDSYRAGLRVAEISEDALRHGLNSMYWHLRASVSESELEKLREKESEEDS